MRIKEKDDPKVLLNIHGYVPFHNKIESKEVLLSLVITDSYPVTYPKVYCLQEHDLDEDKNLPEKLNEAKLHHLQIWNHRNSSLLTILKHTINFSTLKCHIDKELHYANENGVSMEENKFPLNDNLSDLQKPHRPWKMMLEFCSCSVHFNVLRSFVRMRISP